MGIDSTEGAYHESVTLPGQAARFIALRELLDFAIPFGSDRLLTPSGRREIIVQGPSRILIVERLLSATGHANGAPIAFEEWDEAQEAVVPKELPAEGRYFAFSLEGDGVNVLGVEYLLREDKPRAVIPLDVQGAQLLFGDLVWFLEEHCFFKKSKEGFLRPLLARYRGFAGRVLDHV